MGMSGKIQDVVTHPDIPVKKMTVRVEGDHFAREFEFDFQKEQAESYGESGPSFSDLEKAWTSVRYMLCPRQRDKIFRDTKRLLEEAIRNSRG